MINARRARLLGGSGSERLAGVGAKVREHLARRGAPEGSARLAAVFLRSPGLTEGLATRLLRGTLEAAGLRYEEGAGWLPAATPQRAGEPEGLRRLGAALDPATFAFAIAPEGADPAFSVLVVMDPVREGAGLARALRAAGQSAPARVRSLASALRGRVRVPRSASLDRICATLGVRWLDAPDPASRARAIAACLEAASAGWEETAEAVDVSTDVALPAGIAASDLAGLPERPGVYRFRDAEGRLLYVGKASNLRRRVGSYFRPASRRAPARPFVSRIHTVEFEERGSELEALLAEARQIAAKGPEANVQRTLHERGRRYEASRCFGLLLRPARGGGLRFIVVREGGYFGIGRVGAKGGGRGSALRLLTSALSSSTRRRRPREDAILVSWLARHGEGAFRIDLDACRSPEEALRLIETAASGGPGERERVRLRGGTD